MVKNAEAGREKRDDARLLLLPRVDQERAEREDEEEGRDGAAVEEATEGERCETVAEEEDGETIWELLRVGFEKATIFSVLFCLFSLFL